MCALRTLVFAGIGAAALHCPSLSIGQQAFAAFGEVDFFYSQNPQRFRDLWLAAQSQTVRIAVLGDSQESSPTSHGFRYLPLLNYEMWKRFGNSPETPLEGCFFYGGGATPPGNWLVSGRCSAPGPTATRLTSAQILPSVRATAFSTLNSVTNITGGSRGQLTMLQPDAIDVDPGTGIPTNGWYFDTSGTVKARIYAATNVSSGEVAYQARPSDAHLPAYSAAVTTTGTLDLGLQSSTFAIKSAETSALDFGSKRYLALEVFGTRDTALTDIVGLRFVSDAHPEGVVVDTLSLGGYAAFNFLRDHADAGAMFRVFGYSAAVLQYGANANGRSTPEQFKLDISDIIARLRAWQGDAQFPVILIADVYQSGLTPEEQAENDQYVGAQMAIAQADSNVMVINARRLTEDLGWNATSGQSDSYLEDGVHYTALGANVLAQAVVAAMMGEIHATGCLTDPGAASLQSSMTLIVELGGTTACTGHGQLSVAQSLQLNGAALKVALTNGFVPAAGDSFRILSAASTSGSFGPVVLPDLADGLLWNTTALHTQGTISVEAESPSPPATPDPPTISVTSGVSQSVTLPAVPSVIAFTLTGSGTLTVHASSSNQTLLLDSGIALSSGCGASTLTCTATLATVDGQTGAATISLTVVDADNQTAVATATLQVAAANEPPPPPPPPPDPGAGSESQGGKGGGGTFDFLCLLAFATLLMLASITSRPCVDDRKRTYSS